VRSIELEVRTQAGLHARPAAAFVRAVAAFRSTVQLENVTLGRPAIDARSVVGILSAGVEMGHLVRIVAVGSDEERAVKFLSELLAGPDQAVGDQASGEQAASGRVGGRPAAPGIAVGPPWLYAPGRVSAAPGVAPGVAVSAASGADIESLIRGAAETAAAQLNALAARLCDADRPGDAEILEAQALMAVDPAIIDEAVRRSHAGVAPAIAVIDAVIAGARTAGIPVAVCGELAGDPAGAAVLVGLGVDELSADVGSLDGARAALATATSAELGVLAVKSLAATDAETVRAVANELLRARV
jgi:phosphotransferase system HPr (HPr) family protein